MNKLEEQLTQNQTVIDHLTVPDNLENRLREALQSEPFAIKRAGKLFIAAACILFIILLSQADTLAYYGQRLLGYDQVMDMTLQNLNQLGKGQKVGESFQFPNGPKIVLDGVMLDDNQLIAFYTITGSRYEVEKVNVTEIYGKITRYHLRNSTGNFNPEESEIKVQASFEPPRFFEKNIKLMFTWNETSTTVQTGSIPFTLDRKQAMGHTLKKGMNQKVAFAGRKIRFESLLASPTATVIKGTIQEPWEFARDQLKGERVRPQSMEVQLLANQQPVAQKSSEIGTGVDGITFAYEFDALPYRLKTLALQFKSITADFDIQRKFAVNKEDQDRSITIKGKPIIINKLEEKEGDTYLTISSEEQLVLTQVCLVMDGTEQRLEETLAGSRQKTADGLIIHTRTLHFKGTGETLQLFVKRMTCQVDCNKKFNIPLE